MTKGEIAIFLSNFYFCHYVFKKPSVAEASESVYMRERVKHDADVCCRAFERQLLLKTYTVFFPRHVFN